MRSINYVHERAKSTHARDGTRYGKSNIATKSFRRHHSQRISFAVVSEDAINIGRNFGHGKFHPIADRRLSRSPD